MITLEQIKEAQDKLSYMIAEFEVYSALTVDIKKTSIQLKPGEHYAGLILGKDGKPSHHLILLPGEAESVNFADARKWAKEVGGELPSRSEQSLLYANLKEQFKGAWYWSGEAHSTIGYAWSQGFTNGYQGYQGYDNTYGELRARAVRRIVIE